MSARGLYIDGRWVAGNGAVFSRENPTTGEMQWRAPAASIEQVAQAVAAAGKSGAAWAGLSTKEREQFLEAFGQVVKARGGELREEICRETGKPRWEAKTEVEAVEKKIELTRQALQQRRAAAISAVGGLTSALRYKPLGVVAVLGPFNLPAHLPNGQILPALLSGNTVVFKPSELTPRVGEIYMQCWDDAKLPAGVLNMIQGGREQGAALAAHPGVSGIFFTGSHAGGVALSMSVAAQPEKLLALEMGGNNPLVLAGVADVDAAAYTIVQSAFITAGQRCTCARRLIVVQSDAGERVLRRLVEISRKVVVGPYTAAPEPFMGPVISEAAGKRRPEAQGELVSRGAAALLTMRAAEGGRSAMLTPGILDVTQVTERRDEELFGPLLQVIRVADFDAAIAEANRTRFGLVAGLLAEDAKLYERFFARVHAGLINWNRPTTGASGSLPFGGVGASGNHRPAGSFAIDFCSDPVASLEAPALTLPATLAPGDRVMTAVELNLDGLIGPTHNYAGLGRGNIASQEHRQVTSHPRRAALEGLEKMKMLADLGVPQAVLPPQERPDIEALRRLGFGGSEVQVLEKAAREAPHLLAACASASSMWAANAATVSPAGDAADGRLHITPANLVSQLHRSLETATTAAVLRAIFPGPLFVHHEPLPATVELADEGAANHSRLCVDQGAAGLEILTYAQDPGETQFTGRYAPRQSRGASEAITRLHGLSPARTILLRQNPEAIDAGVFHNDVIATGHREVMLFHERAYVEGAAIVEPLREAFSRHCGGKLTAVCVPETVLPLADAVRSYLFNSQLVSPAAGGRVLVAPEECREIPAAGAAIEFIRARAPMITAVRFVEVRQSMHNGGGPACLRLRVVLAAEEAAAMHGGVRLTRELYAKLHGWIERHYREELRPADLADPQLLDECRRALDELTRLLKLPRLYAFQR